jgi:ankyrin repeat protein
MTSSVKIRLRAYEAAKAAIDADRVGDFTGTLDPSFTLGPSPEGGWTILMYAAMQDRAAIVERLVADHGADPNVTNDHLDTAVSIAAKHGAGASLAVLLARGGDPRRRNRDDRDALGEAVCYDRRACVEALLPRYVDAGLVDERDRRGETPLHHAVTFASPEMVGLLIDSGAAIDAADEAGYTPLHNAILGGEPAHAERLLSAGATLTRRLPDGRDVLEVAATKRMRKLLKRHLPDDPRG